MIRGYSGCQFFCRPLLSSCSFPGFAVSVIVAMFNRSSTTRRVNCLVSLFTVLIAGCNAPAQQTNVSTIPNLVNYSGTLLQLRNVAIPSRTVGVTFAIYKQQEGGAPVWLETQNVTVDGSGHYSVVLGTMQAEGLPSDLFAAQEERWLGVKSEGRPEQPRVMLVSVPYAFKAHEAETLGGMPASAFALASESSRTSAAANTSITAAAALTQNNEVRIGLSQGHGTKGYVPLWLNALYLGNSALFQDINRNIGIGTITPAATLDVNGPINTWTSYGIGGQPVLSSPDNVNLFVGINAGANNIGIGNTFVGFEAGQNNTQGGSNAFFGGAAGASNTTGGFGTFFGNNAGVSNTIGFGNSFFGADAGFDNTSGQFNNFFGDNAASTTRLAATIFMSLIMVRHLEPSQIRSGWATRFTKHPLTSRASTDRPRPQEYPSTSTPTGSSGR